MRLFVFVLDNFVFFSQKMFSFISNFIMYKEMNDRMKWCINIKYIVVLNDKTYVFECDLKLT